MPNGQSGNRPNLLPLTAINACRRNIVVDAPMLKIAEFACMTPQITDDPDVEDDGPSPWVRKPGHRLGTSFDYPHLVRWLLTRRWSLEPPIRIRALPIDTLGDRFYGNWNTGDGDILLPPEIDP